MNPRYPDYMPDGQVLQINAKTKKNRSIVFQNIALMFLEPLNWTSYLGSDLEKSSF